MVLNVLYPESRVSGSAVSATTLFLIIVAVDPGSNSTLRSFLDRTNPMVSNTDIDVGVKLKSLLYALK